MWFEYGLDVIWVWLGNGLITLFLGYSLDVFDVFYFIIEE